MDRWVIITGVVSTTIISVSTFLVLRDINRSYTQAWGDIEIDFTDADNHRIFRRLEQLETSTERPESFVIDEYWSRLLSSRWMLNERNDHMITLYRGHNNSTFNFFRDQRFVDDHITIIRPTPNFPNHSLHIANINIELVNAFCDFFEIDTYSYSLFLSGMINFMIQRHGPNMEFTGFPGDCFLSLEVMKDLIRVIHNNTLTDDYLINLLKTFLKNPLIADEISYLYEDYNSFSRKELVSISEEIVIQLLYNAKYMVAVKF